MVVPVDLSSCFCLNPHPVTGIEDPRLEEDLIFTEIDSLLASALAIARYYGRGSVENAITLAMNINEMDYEGRSFERVASPALRQPGAGKPE